MKRIFPIVAVGVICCNSQCFAQGHDFEVEMKNMRYTLNELQSNLKESSALTQNAMLILAKIEEKVKQNSKQIQHLTYEIDHIAAVADSNKKKIDFFYMVISLIGGFGMFAFRGRLLSLLQKIDDSLRKRNNL